MTAWGWCGPRDSLVPPVPAPPTPPRAHEGVRQKWLGMGGSILCTTETELGGQLLQAEAGGWNPGSPKVSVRPAWAT